MTAKLTLGIPSKGRLQEQVVDWLGDCGLNVRKDGGDRGYAASLAGWDDVEVRLISAREIALGLDAGDLHLGVTGEDLLREVSDDPDARLEMLAGLGFGRADLVVAVPKSWIDVATMADLDDVSHRERARTGQQMRVATKYLRLARRCFATYGLSDYRLVESQGATEGAPSAGVADVIVDITTTGATLAANHLKILDDGVILKSQARLAAGVHASWSDDALAAAARLLAVIDARRAGRELAWVRGGGDVSIRDQVAKRFGGTVHPSGVGLVCSTSVAQDAAAVWRDLAGAPSDIGSIDHMFHADGDAFTRLKQRISDR